MTNLFLNDIFQLNFIAADKEIHNLPIFDHPQCSATTERRNIIGGRIKVMREMLTQI